MISFYVLLALFAAFLFSIVLAFIFRSEGSLNAVILCAILLLLWFMLVSASSSTINARIGEIHDTYDTVETSTNEYIRFDYYEKVVEYNSAYDFNLAENEGAWFGWLYPSGWDDGLDYIDFQLHDNEYAKLE